MKKTMLDAVLDVMDSVALDRGGGKAVAAEFSGKRLHC